MKPDIARVLLFCVLSVFCFSAAAVPFLAYDSRTLGMGGIGVASGSYYAQYNNPALLSYEEDFVDWHLLAAGGLSTTDPDDFEDELGGFQSSAAILASSPTPANATVAVSDLQALDDLKFDEIEVRSIAAAIPSKVIGVSVFLNKYIFKSVRAISGVPDISDPAAPVFNSTLEKRGLSVVEQGVAISHVFNQDLIGHSSWSIGFTPKLVFAETVKTSEDIASANTDISFSDSETSSAFSVDAGAFKEFGRYKLAFVVKNLIPMEFDYSDGSSIKLKPQVRVGFAHVKRRRTLEVDLDMTQNDGVGFTNETIYLSMGVEFRPVSWFQFRTGLRQNFKADKDSAISLGLGFGSRFHLDLAVLVSEEEQNGIAQFGIEF